MCCQWQVDNMTALLTDGTIDTEQQSFNDAELTLNILQYRYSHGTRGYSHPAHFVLLGYSVIAHVSCCQPC